MKKLTSKLNKIILILFIISLLTTSFYIGYSSLKKEDISLKVEENNANEKLDIEPYSFSEKETRKIVNRDSGIYYIVKERFEYIIVNYLNKNPKFDKNTNINFYHDNSLFIKSIKVVIGENAKNCWKYSII